MNEYWQLWMKTCLSSSNDINGMSHLRSGYRRYWLPSQAASLLDHSLGKASCHHHEGEEAYMAGNWGLMIWVNFWDQILDWAPDNSSTPTSWETQSQNQLAKPLPDSWTKGNVTCFCFKALNFSIICFTAIDNNTVPLFTRNR